MRPPRLRPGNSSDRRWFNVAWAENECERTDFHLLDPIPLPALFFGGGHRVRVVESTEGLVYEDENVKVTASRVDHGDWEQARGYRFETLGIRPLGSDG